MSKFLDEQDFNSDTETIERNKDDLLKHLATSITRYSKSDPTKFIENLSSPNADTDVSALEKHVNGLWKKTEEPDQISHDSMPKVTKVKSDSKKPV